LVLFNGDGDNSRRQRACQGAEGSRREVQCMGEVPTVSDLNDDRLLISYA